MLISRLSLSPEHWSQGWKWMLTYWGFISCPHSEGKRQRHVLGPTGPRSVILSALSYLSYRLAFEWQWRPRWPWTRPAVIDLKCRRIWKCIGECWQVSGSWRRELHFWLERLNTYTKTEPKHRKHQDKIGFWEKWDAINLVQCHYARQNTLTQRAVK